MLLVREQQARVMRVERATTLAEQVAVVEQVQSVGLLEVMLETVALEQ
jgi:hypothetical protein